MTPHPPMFNLLPQARRMAVERRVALTRWSAAALTITGVMLAPAGALALGTIGHADTESGRVQRTEQSIERITIQRPQLEKELLRLKQTERVLNEVDDRVDWRPILGAISVSCKPARYDRIEARLVRDKQFVEIRIIGLVETLTEARDLTLRLERSGIFSDVVLVGTTRVGLANQEVVRFELTAVVRLVGGA